MKDKFLGYYTPTDGEFNGLWNDAIIVLDANVLLNLYTYSSQTREEFLTLLGELSERLWLPYQAALEYHRRRPVVIKNEAKRYDDVASALRDVRSEVNASTRHPHLNEKAIHSFNVVLDEIQALLRSGKDEQDAFLRNDPIRDRLTELFAGRVGDESPPDELDVIFKDGAKRYEQNIPPGFRDSKKTGSSRYGDLVLWKQILAYAKEPPRAVILVTDDGKEDWWRILNDMTLGPHPELVHEFRKETGQQFYMYTSENFLKTARERGKEISEKAVVEVSEAAANRAEEQETDRQPIWIGPRRLIDIMRPSQSALERYWKEEEIRKAAMNQALGALFDNPAERTFEAARNLAIDQERQRQALRELFAQDDLARSPWSSPSADAPTQSKGINDAAASESGHEEHDRGDRP